MDQLFKICKKHGQLNSKDILKRKNRKSLECRICNKLSYKKKNEKKIEKMKNFIGPILLQYNCNKHGELKENEIYYNIKYGSLSCRICRNSSRKVTLERYKANDKTVKTMICKRHGELNINSMYIIKGGWPICKTCHYEVQHLRKYGLTIACYENLLNLQNNLCKICGSKETTNRPDSKNPRRLSVDHCHKTGRVRGILCSSCNNMIGYSKDSSKILRAAALYLEEHGGKNELA